MSRAKPTLGATELAPRFENVPTELKSLKRWVVWKNGKVPYDPNAFNSKASVKNPDSWGSFEQAKLAYEEGEWQGVGFVLDGTGIVGVDLDKCVVDGIPSPESLAILESLGATYIELSPSGTGLHAYGFADNLKSGLKREYNGVKTELYTGKRYLTVTGHVIQSGPLSHFTGFSELAQKISQNTTEDTQSNPSVPSVPSVASVSSVDSTEIWAIAIPTGLGQRNNAVFHLARWLRGEDPDCTEQMQYQLVCWWHAQNLDVIGTKDLATSWVDFRNAWGSIKVPYGSILKQRLSDLPPAPAIEGLERCGLKAVHLMQICLALQTHSEKPEFFISCRIAAKQLDCDFTVAARLLRLFVTAGWLILEAPGTARKAARYKLNPNLKLE